MTESTRETFRVPCDKVRVDKPVACGMDIYVLVGLAQLMRTTNQDPPPVELVPDGDGWKLKDGRHRFFGAVIAGRPDVLAFKP